MIDFRNIACAVALVFSMGSVAAAQPAQEPLPTGPFKAIHLLTLTPAQEVTYVAAVHDFNDSAITPVCAACAYHLLKVYGANGKYNYIMSSDWPTGEIYAKVHSSAAFGAAAKRNPVMSDTRKTEVYSRYVEVN